MADSDLTREIITRQQASERGLKWFFTGEPCQFGHVSLRQVSNKRCKVCSKESKERFAIKNGRKFRRNHGEPERKAALSAGLTRYSTGVPCQNGHQTDRYSSNGKCVACDYERARRWLAERPGHEAEWKRSQRLANPIPHREQVKRWMQENPTRARSLARAAALTRRAKKAENGGRVTAKDIEAITRRQKGRCAECRAKGIPLEADHITPIKLGGSSDRKNIQMLCLPCNRSKSARDPLVWAAIRGRLL